MPEQQHPLIEGTMFHSSFTICVVFSAIGFLAVLLLN